MTTTPKGEVAPFTHGPLAEWLDKGRMLYQENVHNGLLTCFAWGKGVLLVLELNDGGWELMTPLTKATGLEEIIEDAEQRLR